MHHSGVVMRESTVETATHLLAKAESPPYFSARTAVTNAGGDHEKRLEAENMLTGTLRTLFAVAESYPDLKANTNFLNLQEQLSAIENDLQMARRYYNGTVRNLNTAIQKFPAVLIARQFGFNEAPFFEAEDGEKAVPKVSF